MSVFYIHQWDALDRYLSELKKDDINVSFEFFPPRTNEMENIFWKSIYKLSELKPIFISFTHSSNSNNSDNTYNLIKKIKKDTNINTIDMVPHLTCSNANKIDLKDIAKNYWNIGIRHIIALRGDYSSDGLKKNMYASDLVTLLKKVENFDISVAAYPEVHPEAKNAESDLIFLKKKIEAGANRAITQFFFDVDSYLYFRDRCVAIGIDIDIVPGILPIYNFCQLQKFATVSNIKIPKWIIQLFDGLDPDLETRKMIGSAIVMNMVKILRLAGVKHFHFYTLNRFEITYAICHTLGVSKK